MPTGQPERRANDLFGVASGPTRWNEFGPVPIELIGDPPEPGFLREKGLRVHLLGHRHVERGPPNVEVVTSSHDPSAVGQSVTYTATVVTDSGRSNSPTGSVTFFDGSTPICSNVTLARRTAPRTPPAPRRRTSRTGPTTSPRSSRALTRTSRIQRRRCWSRWSVGTHDDDDIDRDAQSVGRRGARDALRDRFGTPPVPSGSSPSGTVSFLPRTAHRRAHVAR